MSNTAHEPERPKPNPLRGLTDASLNFLATASNGTLGACAVGLCASTYLVLGRVGLVLIGAIGGVVLHATWEGHNGSEQAGTEQASRKRRELGIEVVKRTLDWRTTLRNGASDSSEKVESSATAESLDFTGFRPETRKALERFTDAVISNYVDWWYGPILPDEKKFPSACRQTFTAFTLSISNHLARKRTADPFLDFLANSTSILIVFVNELSAALRASQRAEPDEAIRTYLKYEPESNLANVLNVSQQERKLDLVADDILQTFLDSKAYNFPPSRVFLQEILAKLVLGETVRMCSKPEWINGWIVYLLEEGEPELMTAIDAGVEQMSDTLPSATEASAKSMANKGHQRRISKAEEAMQEALLEAQRMNEMIAEDEARRKNTTSVNEILEESIPSSATTEAGLATPTTSDESGDSLVFDSEGHPHIVASPRRATEPPPEQAFSTQSLNPYDENAYSFATGQADSDLPQPIPSSFSESIVSILTLHKASITIFDDSVPNERSVLKQKPVSEYMLQIEPASSRFPGWITTRKYGEFEALHESLRRIAVISGASQFAQQHPSLPAWKARARNAFTADLEQYLRDALQFETLAESEAMKKFLDKEIGLEKAPARNKNVLDHGQTALENVGKGFINVLGQGGKVLGQGGKGMVGGSKAVLGGVQGVFGAVATGVAGPKKVPPARAIPRSGRNASPRKQESPRSSQELSRDAAEESTAPPLPTRPIRQSSDYIGTPSSASTNGDSQELLNLPPPPSEITSDYIPFQTPPASSPRLSQRQSTSSRPTTPTPSASHVEAQATAMLQSESQFSLQAPSQPAPKPTLIKPNPPITEEETRITIELLFAIITELYSLSSAWTGTFRLSLLSAAKTFLLRPQNPQLESIRALLQDSVIEANTSDDGIGLHINTLRYNTIPTEEERRKWPKELDAREREKLRIKARKLLVERGLPGVLVGVMGQVATGEALGRFFDCLQVEEVARGLIFALLLQGVRAATQ